MTPTPSAPSNLFVLAFDDDGRCREFTEWYMKHPNSTSV
jgi:hypothetical protein